MCPSPTSFDLGLGPTNLQWTSLPEEPLGFRWTGFSPVFALLMSASALACSPPLLTLWLRSACNAPLPLAKGKSIASVAGLSPLTLSAQNAIRPVSCYALFKWWLLLSQHPGCQCTLTSFYTEPVFWGLSWRSGLFPFRQRSLSPAVSLQSSDVTVFGV